MVRKPMVAVGPVGVRSLGVAAVRQAFFGERNVELCITHLHSIVTSSPEVISCSAMAYNHQLTLTPVTSASRP